MNSYKNRFKGNDSIIPGEYWQVNRAGKVLEFRVTPNIDAKPDQYRLGVIQIGRIIYRIETQTDSNKSNPHIQLFPNLAENQLVATVYWPEFLNSDISLTEPKKRQGNYTAGYIRSLAKKYCFKVKRQPLTASEDMKKSQGHLIEIMSVSNQPFIWLKTGQFIEELLQNVDFEKSYLKGYIKIGTPGKSTIQKNANHYTQVILTSPDDLT